MINVVLVEPEIPPNTGNIARTCAATGATLHLVEPLGFSVSEREVRRAGLDYWQYLDVRTHADVDHFLATLLNDRRALPPALLTTKGERSYVEIRPPSMTENLYLLFGPETRGLSTDLLARFPEHRYRIPMVEGRRSLNLSNSVAIVIYELLRRIDFSGLS